MRMLKRLSTTGPTIFHVKQRRIKVVIAFENRETIIWKNILCHDVKFQTIIRFNLRTLSRVVDLNYVQLLMMNLY